MTKLLIKNLADSVSMRIFLDGSKRTVVLLDSVAIGRGEYLPGWQWSQHAGKQTGKNSSAHIGYIISGQMAIKDIDDQEVIVNPGDAFAVGPEHDARVVGDETCVALDFEYLGEKKK